jgi:glucose/arabinose dehydrogenase
MRYLPLLLLPILATLSACDSAIRSQTAPSQVGSPQQPTPRPAQVVKTETLSPQPIRIALNQLPPPYASESASQSPNVIAIPQNPVLRVPAGFVVNVYAEGLDRPRWLALTPDGDVLVTETRQNRIRRLRDTNSDGVADVKETFATPNNGLNQPFGMAFAGNSFFLGNTDAVLRFPYQKGQGQITGTGQQKAITTTGRATSSPRPTGKSFMSRSGLALTPVKNLPLALRCK